VDCIPDECRRDGPWLEDAENRFNIEIDITQGTIADWLADPANQETIQQVAGNSDHPRPMVSDRASLILRPSSRWAYPTSYSHAP
jgi:hypothetical protein